MVVKMFIIIDSRANVVKLFTAKIYEMVQIIYSVSLSLPGRPFQPGLTFVGKAKSLPKWVP